MSVLSDSDILTLLGSDELDIVDMSTDCLRPSSYLLRLHSSLLVRTADPSLIDSRTTNTDGLFTQVDIPEDGFILEPNTLYLGASLERLRFGAGICGELGLLSCYARIGIQLNFGSNLVAATFGKSNPSRLTFEIMNFSPDRIRIYRGVKFCHLRLQKQASPSRSQYAGIYASGETHLATDFSRKPAR